METVLILLTVAFLYLVYYSNKLERKNAVLANDNKEMKALINRLRNYLTDEVHISRNHFNENKDLRANLKQLADDTTEYLRDAYEGTKEAYWDAETFKKKADDNKQTADEFQAANDELRKQLRIVTAKLEMYEMPAAGFQKITIATKG